jgi:hypothetical protein
MQKNVASQKLIVFAFDSATNLPKTGDGGNITAYVSKDYGTVTVLGDTSATEMDSTNAKGYYLFDLTQAETNADTLLFSAKSVTGGIVVVGVPAGVFTTAPNFNKTVIDAAGLSDANMVKLGPTGSGTAQTARDIGASVLSAGNAKKNTALAKFAFMMTDSTNHNPATGKTVTVTRSIDGAAFGAGSLSAVTEVANGIYTVDFASGDLNGNVVVLRATATGCDDTFERVVTLL